MAVTENLREKNFRNRSPEERKEIAAEAGRRSGEARRRKRDLRKCADACLQGKPPEDVAARLSAMGISDAEITNMMGIVLTMIDKALGGDVRAAEFLRDTIGENPRDILRREELKLKKQEMKSRQGDNGMIIQIIDDIKEDT